MARKPGWSGPNEGWTREKLIAKAHEWMARYGTPPLYGDWDRTRLRKKAEALSARAEQAWQEYARYTDGDWPSFLTIQTRFGNWEEFLRAAQLPLDTLYAARPAAARIQQERAIERGGRERAGR